MVASLMAADPREWQQLFSRQNSGTQNNQWMILGLSRWPVGSGARDLLWVLEQQPGMIVAHDMSEKLLEDGFWASYNVPVFPETLAASRYLEGRSSVCMCEAQRKALFDEAQEGIASLADLQRLLTTNTWQRSPLSWNCPKCSIAARFDVAGFNTSIGAEFAASTGNPACGKAGYFGAIDAKVADDTMITGDGGTLFVSGPPHEGVPPFDWATAAVGQPKAVPPHVGHPAGPWVFPWQRFGFGAAEGTRDSAEQGAVIVYA